MRTGNTHFVSAWNYRIERKSVINVNDIIKFYFQSYQLLKFYKSFRGFTFKIIPPFGAKKGNAGSNFIGMGDRSQTENSKFCNNLTIPTLDCMYANREPMQFLGPSPTV
jgi:hypothetical protein